METIRKIQSISGKSRASKTEKLPGSFFQYPLLELFLALNAVARPRNGFQTLSVDLAAARYALAEIAFPESSQRGFDHLQ
jgi:hypothetical protein